MRYKNVNGEYYPICTKTLLLEMIEKGETLQDK